VGNRNAYYGTGRCRCCRRCRCVVCVRLFLLFRVSRSALGSCLLPNVRHQFFLLTLYIYLQEKQSHPTSLDAPSSQRPSLLAISSQVSHSFMRYRPYYFAWLRPVQLLTGRRRRRNFNSTFKSDFPLHNNALRGYIVLLYQLVSAHKLQPVRRNCTM